MLHSGARTNPEREAQDGQRTSDGPVAFGNGMPLAAFYADPWGYALEAGKAAHDGVVTMAEGAA
jgi:hypothetical protein